jgi:hypothetical protein
MGPLTAIAVLLFFLGAVASGYCLGRLLGRTSGCAVALFYLIVLVHVSTDSGFDIKVSHVSHGTLRCEQCLGRRLALV